MKIIFMGTPQFAVPALIAISNSQHQIVKVFTKPPAKSGRGHKIAISKIHELANQLDLPVATPYSLKTQEVVAEIAALDADIIVVAAYGQILPQAVLDICPYGCVNIHPSLLPRWRGAAPIERTIIAGDKETGVCTMQMDAGLDTGNILLCKRIAVSADTTAEQLSDKLAALGAGLLIETLDNIEKIAPIKQTTEGATYASKLTKEESLINWQKSAHEIDCMVRGLNPWPGSFFAYNGEYIRILEAKVADVESGVAAGTIMNDQLYISCGSGILQPCKLQRPGRSVLGVAEFLRGTKILIGTVLK